MSRGRSIWPASTGRYAMMFLVLSGPGRLPDTAEACYATREINELDAEDKGCA